MDEFVLSDNEEDMLYKGICPYCETETVGDKNADHLLFKYKKLCIHTSCDKCKEHFSMYFKLSYSTFYSEQSQQNTPEEKGEKKCPEESGSKIIHLKKALTQKTKNAQK